MYLSKNNDDNDYYCHVIGSDVHIADGCGYVVIRFIAPFYLNTISLICELLNYYDYL